MATVERCRSCQIELPNGPAQTFTFDYFTDDHNINTYRVVTVPLCELKACFDFIEAEQTVLNHYEVCPSQDDLRDPECLDCVKLNQKRSAARIARDQAVARRRAPADANAG